MKRSCRGCGKTDLTCVLTLGRSPLSNDFRTYDQAQVAQATYPLEVFLCRDCKLLQLPMYAEPAEVFTDNYAYFSSYSQTMLAHARLLVATIEGNWNPRFVVEIASNDGYLLQYFKDRKVLGVEPCKNVARAARDKGIRTTGNFFDYNTAAHIRASDGPADMIIGLNVLAHVPNLDEVIASVAHLLAPTGVAVFEFPPVLNLLFGKQIDTIYHEHFSYLSLFALEPILNRHGLVVFDADFVPVHGESYRLWVMHGNHDIATDNVRDIRTLEHVNRLDEFYPYFALRDDAQRIKCQLLEFLGDAARHRELVAGYGAPAKATTLLNYCGIGPELLRFTTDVMPTKVDHYMPGTTIPILHESILPQSHLTHLLILPWNLKEEVVPKIKKLYTEAAVQLPRLWTAIPDLKQIT